MLLTVERITKNFGGLAALSDISFGIGAGSIFGLIGPNGAGKTTLFNCLTGIYRPSAGRFMFAGADITGFSEPAVAQRGIARTFQNIRLFREMTVLENVMVGRHCRTGAGLWGALARDAGTRREEREIARSAAGLLELVELGGSQDALARNLPYGHQRRLEIARALATEPALLCLDEPAAGMNPREAGELMAMIRRIRDRGITVLLIEHHMRVVMGICDRLAVLDGGRLVTAGAPDEVRGDPRVVAAYLGTAPSC